MICYSVPEQYVKITLKNIVRPDKYTFNSILE